MRKVAERTNVLTESNSKNFIHAIVNAVAKGYSDNVISEDIIDLIRQNEVSKGVLAAAPEALRSYAKSLSSSLSFIAEEVESIELQEPVNTPLQVTKKKKQQFEELEAEQTSSSEEEKQEEKDSVEKIRADLEALAEEHQITTDKTKLSASKKASKSIEISEDWEKYNYDKTSNTISGLIKIDFKQDMSMYKRANTVDIKQSGINFVANSIFAYLKNEYPKLKANLTTEIFDDRMQFTDVNSGKAEVAFTIEDAF